VAYERLFTKLTKENLWLYISKLLTERPMYAYEIAMMLEDRFGFSTATITVYVVLYKMLREGLIKKSVKPFEGRQDRRYYELTEKGLETFEKGKDLIKSLLDKVS